MEVVVLAFAPVFAAGFAVQQFTAIIEPILERVKFGCGNLKNKCVIGVLSLTLGFLLASYGELRVLEPLKYGGEEIFDIFVTAFVISAGTEGVNSIMKFLGYAKNKKKKDLG